MTQSLVHELQRDALDPTVAAGDLLRKALAVAWKLDIEDMRNWIQRELQGYLNEPEVPTYRMLRGELRAQNPFHGSVPAIVGDTDLQRQLSEWPCRNSIGEISALLQQSKLSSQNHFISVSFPELTQDLPVYLRLSLASYQGILEAVKTEVLEWTLRLEKAGVLGKGLSFSEEEKQLAQQTVPPALNFHGPVSNSTFQVHSANAYQKVELAQDPRLLELLREIREAISAEQTDEVLEQIDVIEAELASEEPDASKIKTALTALKPTAETLTSVAKLVEILQTVF